MHTTSGLLTYLQQRLAPLETWLVAGLAVAIVLMAILVAVIAAEIFVAAPEPILSAPVRWAGR